MVIIKRFRLIELGVIALALIASPAVSAKPKMTVGCDRACLRGMLSNYIAAMLAHDPSHLPLVPKARFTENGVELPLGKGLWIGISAAANYRYDYLDPDSGGAATHVDFVENGTAGLMSIRLKIVDKRIVEVETVLNRRARNASQLVPTEALWDAPEPIATRLTRAQLARVAESYLNAVASSDGSKAPFDAQTCVRLENGGVMAMTANDHPPQPMPSAKSPDPWLRAVAGTMEMGCAPQLSTGIYGFITSYNNARFPVIDVERQIVFGQWNFRRLGNVKGVRLDGQYVPFMESTQFPNENLLGQAFKIRGGKIIRVQGVFLNANVYNAGTGWGPGLDGPEARRPQIMESR